MKRKVPQCRLTPKFQFSVFLQRTKQIGMFVNCGKWDIKSILLFTNVLTIIMKIIIMVIINKIKNYSLYDVYCAQMPINFVQQFISCTLMREKVSQKNIKFSIFFGNNQNETMSQLFNSGFISVSFSFNYLFSFLNFSKAFA